MRGVTVGGLPLSGPVTGSGCAWKDDASGKFLTFTQDTGESGNSGTAMYSIDGRGRPQLLGVYTGGKSASSARRARGYICPLPNPADMTRYEIVREYPSCFTIKGKHWVESKSRPGMFHRNNSSSTKSFCGTGIFVPVDSTIMEEAIKGDISV